MRKRIPVTLLEDVERIIADPDLLSVREDIALIETRLQQLYNKLGVSYDPENWETIVSIASAMRNMVDSGSWLDSPQDMEKLVKQMYHMVKIGTEEQALWEQIMVVTGEKAKLISQEQRLLVAMKGLVTKEQVASLLTAVADAVRKEVALVVPGDRAIEVIGKIGSRLRAIVNGAEADDLTVINGLPLYPVYPGERIDKVRH